MIENFDNLPENLQRRWIDRLVDGQLSHDEQRQLLLSLEARPDGWRRCALAFLEAQAWRSDFPSQDSMPPNATAQVTVAPVEAIVKAVKWPQWLATALGLVLAFSLGLLARGTTKPNEQSIASISPALNGQLIDPVRVDTTEQNASAVVNRAAWERLKLVIPSDDGSMEQSLEVPLLEGDQTSLASMLAEQEPILSELELKTLQSTGHLVEQHRAYYPVQLQDGRQAVLPMDLVEVKYTGGWQ